MNNKYHDRNKQTYEDLKDVSKLAVNGVVTVGSIAMTTNLMGGMLGAFPPIGK